MLKRAFEAGVPCAWVVSDSLYGADHQTRRLIERHGRGYVLAVTSAQRLGLQPVEDWAQGVPAPSRDRARGRGGGKGPPPDQWGLLPSRVPPARGETGLVQPRQKGGTPQVN